MNTTTIEEFAANLRARMATTDTTVGVLHALDKCMAEEITAFAAKPTKPPLTIDFQKLVETWCLSTFGLKSTYDKQERGDRYLEEVFELLQALDYPMERVGPMLDYVLSRKKGDPRQEVGGTSLTFNALCTAHGLRVYDAALEELLHAQDKREEIKEKHLKKPLGDKLMQRNSELISISRKTYKKFEMALKICDRLNDQLPNIAAPGDDKDDLATEIGITWEDWSSIKRVLSIIE